MTSNSEMGVQDCLQGPRAYKLGLAMGQHIDIIAIYRRRRHRYRRVFPDPTATRCCLVVSCKQRQNKREDEAGYSGAGDR